MFNLSIVAGEYNLTERDSKGRQMRLVARAFKQPWFDPYESMSNDIALLKLDEPLQLTTKVWPACLPSQGEELEPQTNAIILGWGRTSYESNPNGKPQMKRDYMLREAHIPRVDLEYCIGPPPFHINTNLHVICAGYEDGHTGLYKGDSGGPLLVERDNRCYVYGVASRGLPSSYSLYTKTSSYIKWIHRIVSEFSTSRSSI